MLGAVIFDFDGVIVDSERIHHAAFNRVCAQFHVEISKSAYYDKFLGLTDIEVFELLNKKHNLGLSPEQLEELVSQKSETFKQLAQTEAAVIPGVREFLQLLKTDKVPAALCSGALLAEIEMLLNSAKLRIYFETIVSAEHVTRGKPHPEGFLLALAKLNEKLRRSIKPADCIVVEDSRWGLQAARAAGMHTIAVTNTYQAGQLKLAQKIVSNLNDLTIEDIRHLCGQPT